MFWALGTTGRGEGASDHQAGERGGATLGPEGCLSLHPSAIFAVVFLSGPIKDYYHISYACYAVLVGSLSPPFVHNSPFMANNICVPKILNAGVAE